LPVLPQLQACHFDPDTMFDLGPSLNQLKEVWTTSKVNDRVETDAHLFSMRLIKVEASREGAFD